MISKQAWAHSVSRIFAGADRSVFCGSRYQQKVHRCDIAYVTDSLVSTHSFWCTIIQIISKYM